MPETGQLAGCWTESLTASVPFLIPHGGRCESNRNPCNFLRRDGKYRRYWVCEKSWRRTRDIDLLDYQARCRCW